MATRKPSRVSVKREYNESGDETLVKSERDHTPRPKKRELPDVAERSRAVDPDAHMVRPVRRPCNQPPTPQTPPPAEKPKVASSPLTFNSNRSYDSDDDEMYDRERQMFEAIMNAGLLKIDWQIKKLQKERDRLQTETMFPTMERWYRQKALEKVLEGKPDLYQIRNAQFDARYILGHMSAAEMVRNIDPIKAKVRESRAFKVRSVGPKPSNKPAPTREEIQAGWDAEHEADEVRRESLKRTRREGEGEA